MPLSDYVEGRVIPPYREHRYEGILSRLPRGDFINSHGEFARGFCMKAFNTPWRLLLAPARSGPPSEFSSSLREPFPSNDRRLMGS